MMRFQKRGIVAKISGNNCIVLTPQGTYAKIERPSRETRIGEEIAYSGNRLAATMKPMLLVASLLLVWFIFPLLQQLVVPHQAVAYVSLDIHNGVEMCVDKNMKVITAKSYDDEMTGILKGLNIQGKQLDDAIVSLIGQAVALDHLNGGGHNVVVSTISPSSKMTANSTLDQAELYRVLSASLASQGMAAKVKVYTADADLRMAAQDKNLTLGRYLVYQQLLNSGQEVSVEQINRGDISQIAASYGLDLLPPTTVAGVTGQNPQVTDTKALNVAEGESKAPNSLSATDDKRSDTSVSRAYQRDVNSRLIQSNSIENLVTGV